jgi:sulfide:quinone oxidoreductase
MPTVTERAAIPSPGREASRGRVLIAGGGVAGLEALLALHDLAGDRVELTLLCSEPEFVYRPMAIAEPLGRGRAVRHSLAEIAADLEAEMLPAALVEVDPMTCTAIASSGERLTYDALLIAVGAGSEPALRRVLTWTPQSDAALFGGLLRDLDEGYTKRVAFVVPPGVAWTLPAYELALMTAWDARGMGQDDVKISVVTPEHAPLEMFGRAGSAELQKDLDEAGVSVWTGAYVEESTDPPGFVVQPGSHRLDATRVVALPKAAGPRIPGLASDEAGFIRVDDHGRVRGSERVWAAGDAIAFPVKQGGLAAQQADAAAEAIAAVAGADVEPRPFRPVLRGMLLTGRGSNWMRSEIAGGAGEAVAERHALWWPPTKVAGRYLAPYLHESAESDVPSGVAVDLDLERELARDV